MKTNLVILSLIVFLLLSCNFKIRHSCSELFDYEKKLLTEETDLDVEKVTTHFPKKMCNTSNFWDLRANTPLFGANSYGIIYVEQMSIKKIENIKKSFTYIDSVSYYDTTSMRIRHYLVNDTATLFNETILSKYPVPTFYRGLIESDHVSQKWINEVEITQVRKDMVPYSVPDDLMIYIIDAQPCFFYKDKGNILPRPKLGKWTNGYTSGIAISKEESFICYYFTIW